VNWDLLQSNQTLQQFVAALIDFRKRHPALKVNSFLEPLCAQGLPSASFHGQQPWRPDWSSESRQLAWMFCADHPGSHLGVDVVYVIANMAYTASWFECPALPDGLSWKLAFNTGDLSGAILSAEQPMDNQGLLVGERSVIILTT